MTNGYAPLALRADAPTAFGSREEIKSIADRISVMLPAAHLNEYQARQGNRAELQKALDESIYRAAQLCVFYRLVPGEDVHVIPFGNSWAVDMGIQTWQKAADRYCALHDITYHIVTEEMPDAELRERRGENYHPDDTGMVAYLWRSDKKDVYEIFGAKQSMSRAAGIWAKKARYVKGKNEWQEDTVPTQRSKQDVAKRRAMKAVLRLEFSLDSLLAATPAEMRDNMTVISNTLRSQEQLQAPYAPRQYQVDEDGVFVVETPQRPRQVAQDPSSLRSAGQAVEFVVAEKAIAEDLGWEISEPEMEGEPEMEDEPIASEELSMTDYLAVYDRLQGNASSFAQWCKTTHLHSDGPASEAQYRYLVGVINAITDNTQSHRHILSVLIGRAVDSSNPPGKNLCSKLLDWLPETKTDKETGEKVPNPTYRQDYCNCVLEIWNVIRGQLTLFGDEGSEK